MLRGALAAAVTPLRDDGAALDEDAVPPYLDFLAAGGVDGILALGTTGEGILLSAAERRRAAELFLEGRLPVIVHAGAQTTAETVALAEHAAAARAADPVPFYVYELKARSGYAVPVSVVEQLREEVPNLAGLKVSDKPLEAVEPYLLEGLDVFVGAEELLPVPGAAGTVSGLASVFPERVVALDNPGELRAALERFPFQAAAKYVLGRRGVPVREDVRGPLRQLTADEKRELDAWLESL